MQMIADLHTHAVRNQRLQHLYGNGRCRQGAGLVRPCRDRSRPPRCPMRPTPGISGNWSAMPRTIDGVAILYGAEANVVDTKGGLDLSRKPAQSAGLGRGIHPQCLQCRGCVTRRGGESSLAGCVAENPYGLHRPFRAGKLPL